MPDLKLDRSLFAHQTRRALRGAPYSLSLSLSLATGLVILTGSFALAAHFDVPEGSKAFASSATRVAAAPFMRASEALTAFVVPDIEYSAKAPQAASAALALADGDTMQTDTSTANGHFSSAAPSQQVEGTGTTGSTSSPQATIIRNYITQPVIERIVATSSPLFGYVTQAELDSRIAALSQTFGTQLYGAQYPAPATNYGSGGIFNAIALSNRIDNLSNVTITNPTITGGSVEATSFSGTIGASQGGTGTTTAPAYGQLLMGNAEGGYDLVATSTLGLGGSGANTGAANTWTALQLFSAGASTTNQSVFGSLWVGGTATTTILGNATSTFGAGVQATALAVTGSATSTAANGFNLAAGCFAVNGVCIGSGGGSPAWGAITGTLSDQSDLQSALDARLTLTNWYATTTDALDEGVTNQYWTNTRFDNRLSATTSLPSITSLGNLSTVSAALSGIVRATAGALSTALINLASDVSGILPVGNGGTGWANLASDTVLLGNGSGALATTTRGNLTETGSSIFTITGGTGAILGSGATIQVAQANGSTSGFLSSADWTTFNNKQAALGFTPANSTRTVSAGVGLSGGGDLSADRSLSLNLASANAWTGLQQFANASTTLLSVSNGSATTTILGNATSTFGAGVQATGLNITGSATSTAANGFNLTAGCFAVGGVCVGGAASQWTTSGSNIYFTTGSVLIGTTTAGRPLTVFNTSANPQQRVSYDATRYAEWYADAAGAINLTATGKTLNFLDGNFYLCDGGACPTTPVQGYPAFTTNGNLVAGGTIYAGGFGPATCPSGMIPVPPSAADGQQGFCVDKYETQSSSGNAVSVQGGSPWVSVTQYDARAQCIRAGKHLITEKEWMAIAHNVENVGWNWNGGVAGTNQMSDGHSDNSPASALATAADASACSGTGQTCDLTTWSDQRRTYKLSNGEYIWDFGGNVWEWVDQANQEDYPIANSAAAGWQACSTSGDGVCGNTRTTNDQWYRGGTTALRGFLRGGGRISGADSGAFTLALDNAPSATNTNVGFRCSR